MVEKDFNVVNSGARVDSYSLSLVDLGAPIFVEGRAPKEVAHVEHLTLMSVLSCSNTTHRP